MRPLSIGAVTTFVLTVVVVASGDLVRLNGRAETPSNYLRLGPMSGQFTSGTINGVTPPCNGQPIPGFSGMIPAARRGRFIALRDNGFGAQTTAPTSPRLLQAPAVYRRRDDGLALLLR